MSNVLVIAEKPSVGMSLAAVLGAKERKDGYVEGNGYIVSWCVGHLAGLADAFDYNEQYGKWRREDLPIIPDEWKFSVFEGKQKQFNILRGLMNRKDVEKIVNACDSGREGELIFRFVYQLANCTKFFSRLWISSLEENAIKKGFSEMKNGSTYDPLFFSALCRAKADWLIGINATRLFSTLYSKTLNVGRVQTPTLAMLAERQNKISGFVKEKFYKVWIDMQTLDGTITAQSKQIFDTNEAAEMQTACHKRQAVCISLTKEEKIIAPPKLFDLTALQRESNRLLGYTAMQTLDAAQKLYELKLITYPRTDSRFITSDMAAGISALVQNSIAFLQTPAFAEVQTSQIVNDSKVSDHHAIIPTTQIEKFDFSKINANEKNIFSLIAARLIFSVAAQHVYEATTATFECNGNIFTVKGKTIVAEGWKALEKNLPALKTKSPDDDGAIPQIFEGQTFANVTAAITEHFTQPPAPFTEATLLSAMENAGAKETTNEAERRGLGTPATRAAVIEKLVNGGFITRNGRQLIPTSDGENLIKILPDTLKSPELTANWENTLTRIAKGEADPENFMREIENMSRELIKNNSAPVDEYKNFFGTPKEAIGICPRCGEYILESKKNFHCENRECFFVMWKQDRFFTSRKKELTKTIATELLKNGKAKITGLFSEKKNKTFDAVILLADTGGKYVNYRFDIKEKSQTA